MPHVLVVDDNPLTLHYFSDALAAIGIESTRAGQGALAIELAAQQRFDLLLIDARMPEIDGKQTLHAIRSGGGASCNAPAIATTAADGVAHADLLGAGFAEVIIKPVALTTLRASLARQRVSATAAEADARADSPAMLDDAHALAATGEDAAIVTALRGLLVGELDLLPAECAEFARNHDRGAMRDRLHRLAASAGFCGATALATSVEHLRLALDDSGDMQRALTLFLATCMATRTALDGAAAGAALRPDLQAGTTGTQ